MKSIRIWLSIALALSLPAVASAGEPSTTSADAPVTNVATEVSGTEGPASQVPHVPASSSGVRDALSNAFRASEQGYPCDDDKGVGCTIAETALGSAWSDEREEYRANEFLRER